MITNLLKPVAYYWKKGRKIIVQNCVGPYLGQKHEHTPTGFKKWRKSAEKSGFTVIELPKGKKP